MTASLNLSQLTDLALGTPEVGAVNFNVLHTLLHAIIKKIGIQGELATINEADKDFLAKKHEANDDDKDSAITEITSISEEPIKTGKQVRGSMASNAKDSYGISYPLLEKKIADLEKKFEKLDALPTSEELLARVLGQTKSDSNASISPKPVNDMWQIIQLRQKVDANELGIEKLVHLMQTIMEELANLKQANAELQADNDKLNKEMQDIKEQLKDLKSIDEVMKKLQDLEKLIDKLEEEFSHIPPPEEFENFVTWQGLEKALKGLKEDVEELNKPLKNAVVIETSSQTETPSKDNKNIEDIDKASKGSAGIDAASDASSQTNKTQTRPASAQVPSRPQSSSRSGSRASHQGPSGTLAELLEKLGKLNDKHHSLDERVTKVEDQLKNKADVSALDNLKQQLQNMKTLIDGLAKGGGQTSNQLDLSPLAGLDLLQNDFKMLKGDTDDIVDSIAKFKAETFDGHNALKNMIIQIETNIVAQILDLQKKFDTLREIALERPSLDQLMPAGAPKESVIIKEVPKQASNDTQLSISMPKTSSKESSKGASITQKPSKESIKSKEEPLKQLSEEKDNIKEIEERKAKSAVDLRQASSGQLASINQKLKFLQQDNDRQLNDLNKRAREVDSLINQFKDELKNIKGSGKGHEGIDRLRNVVKNLQDEIDRLNNLTRLLSDQNGQKQATIEELQKLCKKLQDEKADKQFVENEVELKADRKVVDGKVNKALFDTTNEELKKLINDILDKLTGHEDDWKKAISQLNDDLDGKLDRMEFGPIKDQLERQLKNLLKKLKNMHFPDYEDEEAAGIRKQLLTRFHCISCDKSVAMGPHGPVPSIPSPPGLPATRSTRPYTTYELEQIRQHARSTLTSDYTSNCKQMTNFELAVRERQLARLRMIEDSAFVFGGNETIGLKNRANFKAPVPPGQQVEVSDLYATQRACGGSHTTTYPHKRVSRMAHLSNLYRDDELLEAYKNELDIQGADGHLYKGRQELEANRFMTVPATAPGVGRSTPAPPSARPHTSMAATHNNVGSKLRPSSAKAIRPTSGRQSPRIMSSRQRISSHQLAPVEAFAEDNTQAPPPPEEPAQQSPPPEESAQQSPPPEEYQAADAPPVTESQQQEDRESIPRDETNSPINGTD